MSAGWKANDRRDLAQVAAAVVAWIDHASDSPLYVHLARGIAEDAELLALVARIENLPPLNLLFGGVKLRLTRDDALAAWYPYLAGDDARAPDSDAYGAFREFALARVEDLVEIGRTRRTQTNEAARSAVILPLLAEAADAWGEPVHLVDVGASAGLNLCLDRFDYRYRTPDGGEVSVAAAHPASARLTLTCDARGELSLPAAPPAIASRHGIDLMPVDAADPDQAAWLEALVWPEHGERLERLRDAIAIRRETPVTMHAGDAVEVLEALARELPPGPMLVFHTVMTYQLSDDQQAGLDAAVLEVALGRRVARVWMEPTRERPYPELRTGLTRDTSTRRGWAHAHGRWLDAT